MVEDVHAPALGQQHEIHAGFIPLSDCAPLIIASELGFDRRHGFSLVLHREASWANIRDKVDVGALDCAHMLAPMPIAAHLGLGRATEPIIAPMAMSLNGNAITVSNGLYGDMLAEDRTSTLAGSMKAATALASVVRNRQASGRAPLTFGTVYPFSCHNYDLRYWLAAAGIDPDNDVNLVVVPPPLIAENLKASRVDGFCVGQPWNSAAVREADGVILATKSQLWAKSPEKVLGVREIFAEKNPQLVRDLVGALVAACEWLDTPGNRDEAAHILARPEFIGIDVEIIGPALNGKLRCGGQQSDIVDPDLVVFHRNHANFPWRSHAVWLMTQMIRWGQVIEPFSLRTIAERAFRTDIYREAVGASGGSLPSSDYKSEGIALNGVSSPFFGDEQFDPSNALPYLAGLAIRHPGAELEAFSALNG